LQRDPEIQVDPLHIGPRMTGKQVSGRDILLYRNRLPGRKFTSKEQLKDLIGEENFRIIADYVTAHAWVNPYTVRAADGREPTKISLDQTDDTLAAQVNPAVEGAPRVSNEPRAPININTAPKPVLIACLKGLGGRRAFPYTEVANQNFENQNRPAIEVDGSLPPTQEEFRLLQVPVWVYTMPLTIEQAEQIAEEIIRVRKERPFKVWRSGDPAQPGFEEFVNLLPEQFFPPASSFSVVNPRDQNNSGRYKSGIQNNEGSREMWQRGHDSGERGARRQVGLPASGANAWYYDTVRDVLKANFNPNARLNKLNPNGPAFVAVDKANVVKLGNEGLDANDVHVAHTTEFCFDSMGIYEVSTLAEILVGDTPEQLQVFAETQRRSVVKVFEVLHHTTQRQFEQPFNEAGRTSFRDRENVTTYPDAMDALEPDYFHGSSRDGRIELSGSSDAERKALRPELRDNVFGSSANLRLAHDFRFRDPRSAAELKRLLGNGGLGTKQVETELKRILDPDFSAKGANFAFRYSPDSRWGGMKDSALDISNIEEPTVDTAESGGDVQPDGLNMSFFRVPRSGTRILRFPAKTVRQNPASQGEEANYNNDVGNLPYYQGGVSFWIKLEFDGNDPIFHGLLKATQVQTRVGPGMEDSEGTQFVVWKNTTGELRITRLYYHQAFLPRDGESSGSNDAVPQIGEEQELSQEDFPVDDRKSWARTDVIVDVRNWKAHEWHHVVIEFNDEHETERIQVRLDGEKLDYLTNHNLGLGKFCALNEEEPKDEIQLGGIFRDQAVSTEGLFKFGTNVTQSQMQEVAPDKKWIPANATIDSFQTFLGTYDPGTQDLGYFTRNMGRYTNRFEIPFPEGIQRIRLRSFTWTAYPPALYGGLGVRWIGDQDLEANVIGVGDSSAPLRMGDAGGEMTLNSRLAGNWLNARGTLFGRTGSVTYQFNMRGAFGQQKYGDRIVASPVIDDVTLTYYLPAAEILQSEQLD